MKKMKHGGKARKSHKRMQDGGITSYGSASNLKPGMQALASSDAYMRRPGRGNEGMYRPIGRSGRGGSFSDIQGIIGGAMGLPIRGGGMTSDIGSVPMGRGGAMASMEAQPVRLPGRGGAMPSAISRGIASGAQPMGRGGSIGGATGYQAGGGMTSDADSVPMGRGFRKGGAVKAKKNMRGGGLARKGVGMALAKGGLAKRAGGCAKRGVGRGKMV
jgi:hypothetical protein